MEVNYLEKDEIEYELEIRGITGVMNADARRVALRNLLKMERENMATIPDSPLRKRDPQVEMEAVSQKLPKLESRLILFKGKLGDSEYKKISTIFHHSMSRLNRCHIPEDSPLLRERSELLQKLVEFKGRFDEKILNLRLENLPPGVSDAEVKDFGVESDPSEKVPQRTPEPQPGPSRSKPRIEQTPTTPIPLNLTVEDLLRTLMFQPRFVENPRKVVPTCKWGITFSGDGKGKSLRSFLEDIEVYSRARNATEQDLWNGALDFFEGPALQWFKSVFRELSSWSELVALLKEEYEDEDYLVELTAEMLNRTQGPDEKFGDFVAVMKTFFSRVNLSEEEQLKILYRNTTPYFYDRLRQYKVESVADFVKIGRRLQNDKIHMDKYKPPPTAKKSLLEPSLAYTGSLKSSHLLGEVNVVKPIYERYHPQSSSKPSSNQPVGQRKGPTQGSMPRNTKCYNCGAEGHYFSRCSLLGFCPGCGNRDFTKPVCRRCPPAPPEGNANGRRK